MGMTRNPARAALAATLLALAAATLSGCSGGTDINPAALQVLQAGRQQIAARRAERQQPPRPPLTRAVLDTVEISALEVVLERRDILAYVFIQAERDDDSPGRIVVWRSEDDVTLAMRNDMLIATRGLGGDIVSSAVPAADGVPGPATAGARTMRIRALDNREVGLVLACDLADLGPETVTIVELAHATRHMRETCEAAGGGTVINDYWVDSRNRLVWQSRQWAGPVIGYIRTRRLTTG